MIKNLQALIQMAPAPIQALEKRTPLYNQRVVLVRAGGVAQAIAQAAMAKGASVTFINRAAEKSCSTCENI